MCPEKPEKNNQKPWFQRHPEPEVARQLGGASQSGQNRWETLCRNANSNPTFFFQSTVQDEWQTKCFKT